MQTSHARSNFQHLPSIPQTNRVLMSEPSQSGAGASAEDVESKLAGMNLAKDADGFFTVAPSSGAEKTDATSKAGI